jgi:hypothetical protein
MNAVIASLISDILSDETRTSTIITRWVQSRPLLGISKKVETERREWRTRSAPSRILEHRAVPSQRKANRPPIPFLRDSNSNIHRYVPQNLVHDVGRTILYLAETPFAVRIESNKSHVHVALFPDDDRCTIVPDDLLVNELEVVRLLASCPLAWAEGASNCLINQQAVLRAATAVNARVDLEVDRVSLVTCLVNVLLVGSEDVQIAQLACVRAALVAARGETREERTRAVLEAVLRTLTPPLPPPNE